MAKKQNPKIINIRFNFMWIWGAIIAIILAYSFFGEGQAEPVACDWNTVEQMVVNGEVERIKVVNKNTALVYLTDEAIESYRNGDEQSRFKNIPEHGEQLNFTIGSVDILDRDVKQAIADSQVENNPVAIEYLNEKNSWSDMLINFLPWVFLIGIWFLFIRMMSRGGGGAGGNIMNVGKARAQEFDKDNPNKRVTFKDVAGLAEAKVEIMEIVDFLRKADKYRELGAKIPKGALLVGPPGTGKTLLAKAVAGEANVPFLSISGSDFVEMFVGVGASRVRDLFEQAKRKAPCIVFIDEIDAIGRARGKNAGFSGNDERENTLNQLLTEMDGFQTNAGVIVLAATNRADILDKALMRAGRFDRQIDVGLPDVKEREEIFNVHLRNIKLGGNIDRTFLAKQTPGFSGADIANVCNEAALIAARKDKNCVERDDFMAAIDRIVGGLEKRNKTMSEAERRATAIHEAGHAVATYKLPTQDPVRHITIIPRGQSLGSTWSLPADDSSNMTRNQMYEEIVTLLGGRVAEALFIGDISVGASNDIDRATKLAKDMVARYGMCEKLGTVSYLDGGEVFIGRDYQTTKSYSEKVAGTIDEEVKNLIDRAYDHCAKILKENEDKLNELVDFLLQHESISGEQFEALMEGRRIEDCSQTSLFDGFEEKNEE